MSNKYGFHTLALHAGAEIDKYYLPVLFTLFPCALANGFTSISSFQALIASLESFRHTAKRHSRLGQSGAEH